VESNAFKMCRSCGRRVEWQAKWARCWDRVRYCDEVCRRQRPDSTDHALEDSILGLLACRHVGDTICPSEAAGLVAGTANCEPLVERSIRAARRLVNENRVEIIKVDRVVDPLDAHGAIRLRLPRGVNAIRPAA
jgi:hypothetical protein